MDIGDTASVTTDGVTMNLEITDAGNRSAGTQVSSPKELMAKAAIRQRASSLGRATLLSSA
jgi:hypothetical protein